MKDTNLEQIVRLMKDTVEVASRASSPCACIRLPGFTGVRHGQHPVPGFAPVCDMDLLSQKGMRKQLLPFCPSGETGRGAGEYSYIPWEP